MVDERTCTKRRAGQRGPRRSAGRARREGCGRAASESYITSRRAERSQAALDDVERSVAAHGDVDAAVAAHHAAEYRAWAERGGEGDRPVLQTPAALVERKASLTDARSRHAAARDAHAALAAEHDEAERALESAKDTVHAACKAVMAEEADRLAAELDAVLCTAHLRQDQLLALADFPAMGRNENWASGKLRLSAAALGRATTPLDHRAMLPGTESYSDRQAPSLQRLMAALQAGDADARL
jgi:hypothetical protein